MALVFQEVVHRPVAELSGIAMEGGFAGSLRLLGNVLFLKLSYVVFMLGWSGVNSLVLYIQEALQRQRLWEVVERHVPPSSNMVTDPLERLAHHTSFEVVVLEQPSLECAEALQRDGVTWEKMKAMEEIVEFLGVFCGDKVACVSKGTDLVGSLQKSGKDWFHFQSRDETPQYICLHGLLCLNETPGECPKASIYMISLNHNLASPVMISLIPCPVILLLVGLVMGWED
ncbi:hypothetical protein V6N12_062625 [Hibiscus sabdariffa]|uniref:Uncharacterized protein n=1 Tax=Hibiscus sabdariffa TaxID=183260 RepID=A0ABR2F9H1_9ROSI